MNKIDEYSIAIIGMSGRFPGANSIEEFWGNLAEGKETIKQFSNSELDEANVKGEEYKNSNYVPNRGVLNNISGFDASFFGYTPREAQIADPQHRLMLECAWEVFEDAGYIPEKYKGIAGVYVGSSTNTYMINNILPNKKLMESLGSLQILIGNEKDHLATKIAYKLDLKGPAITIQTACSTSLVAIHMACQSLLSFETDVAIAGGVSINVPQEVGHMYTKNGVGSSDGHCRAFDEKADGTVAGNGAGLVLLKRATEAVKDGDRIHAIIRGSAINNDGKNKVGYAAPSIQGQAQVIANAQQQAGVTPNSISYIEAHGTGTELGDPIEVMGLIQAFEAMEYESTPNKCAIGSLKPNIGHLDAASGVASLIKCVMALKNKKLPPSINYSSGNPEIPFADSPFYVNTSFKDWPKTENPRRCGVSSFGIGGTNAHLVLEEAPDSVETNKLENDGEARIFNLSAKTQNSLKKNAENLAVFLKMNDLVSLEDVSYTLRMGRSKFHFKETMTARTIEELVRKLEKIQLKNISVNEDKVRPVFLFSGQGSSFTGAGRELYRLFPIFKETIDFCSEYVQKKINVDIKSVLLNFTDLEYSLKTDIAQPALFILEYSLYKLLNHLGVKPEVLIGHSIGEYTAACVAGVLKVEDMLDLVIKRGEIMAKSPTGSMLAIFSSEEEILPYLTSEVTISARNAPRVNIVSGFKEEIALLSEKLQKNKIKTQILKTNHGFHSRLMDGILEEFREFANTLDFQPTKIPLISNDGNIKEIGTLLDADHWVSHLRNPVEFKLGIEKTLSMSNVVFLEVGPGSALTSLVHHSLVNNFKAAFALLRENEKDLAQNFLEVIGELWKLDVPVQLEEVFRKGKIVSLPPYEFDRKRHWIDAIKPEDTIEYEENETQIIIESIDRENDNVSKEDLLAQINVEVTEIWKEILGVETIERNSTFFDLEGHSLTMIQMVGKIHESFGVELSIKEIFEKPTIAEVSKMILDQLLETADAN